MVIFHLQFLNIFFKYNAELEEVLPLKKFVITISLVMVIGLLIGIFFYNQTPNRTLPDIEPQPEEQNIDETPTQPEQIQGIYVNEQIGYSLQNDRLQITFDKGKNWTTVPVEKDQLFAGEYNGNKQELIGHSYLLTENRTAFLYAEEPSWDNETIRILYTLDQGKTWMNSVVTEHYMGVRFRKVGFVDDQFGYIIISGGRTMSQEGSNVFLTFDGGQSWQETNNSGVSRLIADGGFVDAKIGFLSFGTINPEAPELYVTQDGGNTWKQATVNIPSEYANIFVQAETPFIEDDHLAVFVNQGPNGDYKGGLVKGKFISTDKGNTWAFSMEVSPDEANK